MRSFASAFPFTPSGARRALVMASLLVAAALPACSAPRERDVPERSPRLGSTSAAQRTREGHAHQLRAFAREVTRITPRQRGLDALPLTAEESASFSADAGGAEDSAGPTFPPALDAGADAGAAPEAGAEPSEPSEPGEPSEPSEPAVDAGTPPPAPPSPSPPPPLPRNIVEQSALPLYGLEAGVYLSEAALWDRLAESPAVCFGEYHDVPAHHYAEARALVELAARASRCGSASFAVGFEMFQRPFQAPLSAFVAGELGEAEFLEQTEYPTRWGYDFSLYRPLLEAAQRRKLPALALNMQREITRKIGRTGLESLSDEERAELPELDLQDEEHRAYIFGLFGVLPEHAAELGLENIYTAQTVWDETMADTSARWLAQAGDSARLLDFAGGAHCHRSAIPRRITRRTGQPALAVHAVFESELADGSFSPEGYDVLVVLDD